jgi:hypothetical protein
MSSMRIMDDSAVMPSLREAPVEEVLVEDAS